MDVLNNKSTVEQESTLQNVTVVFRHLVLLMVRQCYGHRAAVKVPELKSSSAVAESEVATTRQALQRPRPSEEASLGE